MESTDNDFLPVAFDARFLLTDDSGHPTLAIYRFPGNAAPTEERVRAALAEILTNEGGKFRPMTRAEVELLDAKTETRQ